MEIVGHLFFWYRILGFANWQWEFPNIISFYHSLYGYEELKVELRNCVLGQETSDLERERTKKELERAFENIDAQRCELRTSTSRLEICDMEKAEMRK
jgi:hypothetical protein